MVKKSTKEEFISKARAIHGDKYIYDEFEYVNAVAKGKIICPKHGVFLQSANVHLKGHGCPKCASEVTKKIGRLTFDIFQERANKKHNGKYTYIPTELRNGNCDVRIICPIHGEFTQNAVRHMYGQGCPKCGNEEKRKKMANGLEYFLSAAKEVHGDKYDYSKVKYINNKTKVCIICPEHGEFWQRPFDHIIGKKGCQKCVGRGLTLHDFEKLARKVHGDRYDYLSYSSSDTKARILCKKCGREFTQKGWSHLQGHGCPYCKQSKLEWNVLYFLEENNVTFEAQKKFDWLGNQSLDFYLPNCNIAIECQGEQHFKGSRCFGHKELEGKWHERDKVKKALCDENGIELIYYTNARNAPDEYIGTLFTSKEEMLNFILKKVVK